MSRALFVFGAILAVASAAAAQDKVPLPPGPPPTINLARAVKNDDKIQVIFTKLVYVPVQKTVVAEVNGKRVEQVVVEHVPQIQEVAIIADGKFLTVTRKDGKNVDPAELPRLLPKATAVVLFDHGTRDARYLELLRDDALVITLQPRPLPVPPLPKE